MLAAGPGEHHQLHVRGVCKRQAREGVHEVVDPSSASARPQQALLAPQGATRPPLQHVDEGQGLGLQLGEQAPASARLATTDSAMWSQRGDPLQLSVAQLSLLPSSSALEADAVFGDALDAAHGCAAVAGDVGGLGRPGRDCAQARRDEKRHAVGRAAVGIAIAQQRCQALLPGRRAASTRCIGARQCSL